VAFSAAAGETGRGGRGLRRWVPTGLRTQMRSWLGPLTLSPAANRLGAIVQKIKPDLVHAMRIPYEGMLAAETKVDAPLLVSVWGNDLTLHALSNRRMGAATRTTLEQASALHTDTQRDQRLAAMWGFDAKKPAIVVPGNGGVRREVFFPAIKVPEELRVVNPRGLRAYVRNDVFFQAIPKVLRCYPQLHFDCPAMQGEPEAERWVQRLGIGKRLNLLPKLNAADLAEVYRAAQVMVSPSTHDGTPNSLLEGLACGCFPVAGDLESIREWITPGENGLLFDSNNSQSIANAIISALENKNLREKAAGSNQKIIAARAEYKQNMQRAEEFYERVKK